MQKNRHQRRHICFSLSSEPELTHTIHLNHRTVGILQPSVNVHQPVKIEALAQVNLLQPPCIILPVFIEMHPVSYVTPTKDATEVHLGEDEHTVIYFILFYLISQMNTLFENLF